MAKVVINYRRVPKAEQTGKRQKWELTKSCDIQTNIKPKKACWIDDPIICDRDYVTLLAYGLLLLYKGYRWDGASFFLARDSEKTLRATLVHDCGYQLIRDGELDTSYRKAFDKLMYNILVEDSVWKIEAWFWYQAVRIGGRKAARK